MLKAQDEKLFNYYALVCRICIIKSVHNLNNAYLQDEFSNNYYNAYKM